MLARHALLVTVAWLLSRTAIGQPPPNIPQTPQSFSQAPIVADASIFQGPFLPPQTSGRAPFQRPPRLTLEDLQQKQPLTPHEHWHVDISYVNICGTFYYLTSVLDGCSRFLVHWELRESMREADVEVVLQRAREKFPDTTPRIITDNGPQFIARDFHEFIRLSGMTHVRTSPYYPQSNGKIERWHGTLKADCLRPHVPLSLEEARRLVESFVQHYNYVRLHSAIGYITPADKLAGREAEIFAVRDRKLDAARERRRHARWLASAGDCGLQHETTWAEDRATQRCDPSAVPGVGVKRCAGPQIGASPIPSLQHQCAKPDWHDANRHHPRTMPFNSLTPEGLNSISR
jgi:transposase InsO family protein